MAAQLLQVDAYNPSYKLIEQAAEILRSGGIIILPTDSVYAYAVDLHNPHAVELISKAKGLKETKSNYSLLCQDISEVSDYTLPFSRSIFKVMNRNLPGPFTFILPANKQVSKHFKAKRQEIGVRIPDHPVTQALLAQLGRPLITSSVVNEGDDLLDYYSDPDQLWDDYQNEVDAIINSGSGQQTASTVVDCTGSEPEIIRQGQGELLV